MTVEPEITEIPRKVGYRHPPVEHQWVKGQSGNPPGRAKGSFNQSELVTKAMSQKTTLYLNGKRVQISLMEVAYHQLAKQAAGGDRHCLKLAVELLYMTTARDAAAKSKGPKTAQERNASDMALLQAIKEQAENLEAGDEAN